MKLKKGKIGYFKNSILIYYFNFKKLRFLNWNQIIFLFKPLNFKNHIYKIS